MSFAPRGANFATDAAIANAQIMLRGAENAARIREAVAERRQRREMAELEIQAQRERDARIFEQRSIERQQEFEMQSIRDHVTNGYDNDRLERRREWDLYDKTMEETGTSPAQIRADSLRSGASFDEVYAQRKQDRQKQAREQEYQDRLRYAREAANIQTDIATKKQTELVRRMEDKEREIQSDPKLDEPTKTALLENIAQQKFQAAFGFDMPKAATIEDDMRKNVVQHPETGRWLIRKKDGTFDPWEMKDDGPSNLKVDDTEIDWYLDDLGKKQYEKGSSYVVTAKNEDGTYKLGPKTAENFSPEERWKARMDILTQRMEQDQQQRAIYSTMKRYGCSPKMAAEIVERQTRDNDADAAIKQALEEADRRKKEADVESATGASRTATGENDPAKLDELRRALSNPNLTPELRAQIEAKLRGR